MNVRKPVVAGMFYDQGKDSLERQVSFLFKGVKKGSYFGVVSPHAGYMYSGKTSANAVNSLKPNKAFVILGPNHNLIGSEFSIMTSGEWKTPLGSCRIDQKLARILNTCDVLEEDEISHMHEHSIEVQLPFLQHRFKDFQFVPISITNTEYSRTFLESCESLGKTIAEAYKKQEFGMVASSDFSHYLPQETAKERDEKAIEKIESLDTKGLLETLMKTNASVCGYGPICVLMSAAKNLGMKKVKVIDHTTSGDVTGDFSSVVSYYAIGFG